MCKNLCVTTTLSTIGATAAYAIVIYFLRQEFDLQGIVIFAAMYGLVFYFAQRYFSKRAASKKATSKETAKKKAK